MKKFLPVILVVLILVAAAAAMSGYKQANAGRLLAQEYFVATPVDGYGTQRALAAAGNQDAEASILRQGIRYHQQGDYDLALISLRAYLEDQTVTEDYLPGFLAGTAAFATGQYGEAQEFIDDMAREDRSAVAAYHWQSALLSLRKEDFSSARQHLESVLVNQPAGYAAKELLGRFP